MPSYRDYLRTDIVPSFRDSLMHYGVKGMRWGHRSTRSNISFGSMQMPGSGGGGGGYEDPRQTSDIEDDGREVANFKDLWYDSNNYITRRGLKVYKDESGDAYIKDNGKIYSGKNAFQALRQHKIDKMRRRRALRQN